MKLEDITSQMAESYPDQYMNDLNKIIKDYAHLFGTETYTGLGVDIRREMGKWYLEINHPLSYIVRALYQYNTGDHDPIPGTLKMFHRAQSLIGHIKFEPTEDEKDEQ